MFNFRYYTPTEVLFGKGTEEQTGAMVKKYHGTKVLIHYGGGSVIRSGLLDKVKASLDREGIGYASCPGVSACFGAAADMNLEYTLPGVSQTLIITRLEGRTGVPEKESMQALASHGASMAIYLSAGMLERLSEELLRGGYTPDTPAAIVYKATWPEEKILPCTVKDLAETAKKAGVSKTAVVLVGRAVGTKDYERSKLYDPTFSTGYRAAKEE